MFDDIIISSEFIEDYDALPKTIQKCVDRRIHDWAIIGKLPPSAQAHKAERYNTNIWICYLTTGAGAYRMLVEIKEKKLFMHRVGDHEKISRELNLG